MSKFVIGSSSIDTIHLSGSLFETGSAIFTGDVTTRGTNIVRLGIAPAGSSGSYGVGSTSSYNGAPFTIHSQQVNGLGYTSIEMLANVNNATIHDEHNIVKIGWLDSAAQHTTSWVFKPYGIESGDESTAEVVGSEADGGAAIGVILGSSASYSTVGSKLVSIQNNGFERENIYHDGTKVFCETNNGAYLKETYFENLVSISGSLANLYFTADQVPAGASVGGVGVRVYSTFHTSSGCWFAIGLSSSVAGFSEYWGDYIGVNAGVTNETGSFKNGWTYFSEDSSLCLSSSVLQQNITSGATGSVRVVCFYRTMGPLVS